MIDILYSLGSLIIGVGLAIILIGLAMAGD